MKRNYESGYAKRKKKAENKRSTDALPKLTAFFTSAGSATATTSAVASPEEATCSAAVVEEEGGGGQVGEVDVVEAAVDENVVEEEGEQQVGQVDVVEANVDEEEEQALVSRQTTPSPPFTTPSCVISLGDDPAHWPGKLTDTERCVIVRRGPVQLVEDFPQNQQGRRFTPTHYFLNMKNGEKIKRSWLVYSKAKDRAFCFCCRLFGECNKQRFGSDGNSDWKNLAALLKDHEKTADHLANMTSWRTLHQRLVAGKTIDAVNQELFVNEVNRWREILKRLVAIVVHLAERNLAFRGHSEKLYEPGNGNFLGQVQLMAQFDPVMREHVKRVANKEVNESYFSKSIQNELICLVANTVTQAIVERVKRSKYFSVIMDCTPDVSHTEQLSMVLRVVNCEPGRGASIHEHFVGFLVAEDTTGKGLLELFLGHLQALQLNLDDCRGQSYDNGSNMQGKKQGVQTRILELNSKALCVPCASHTLNLVVGDAAKSSVASLSFFGLLQRLYALFSASVHRWTILQKHVKDFSLKPLSATRWEARVESVKAVRYQLPEILDALSALKEYAEEKQDSECASNAHSLQKEMGKWPFLVSVIVWHNVLYHINKVSKMLQSPKVSVEVMRREITAVIEFLKEYRENGFTSAKTDAREIAERIDVEMAWPETRQRKKKRQFEYEGREETVSTAEEVYRREVFLHMIDTTLVTVRERFSHMEAVFELYGFLYSTDLMRNAMHDGKELDECCHRLERKMNDVDAEDLKQEIIHAVTAFPPHVTSPFQMLDYVYKENILDTYPNLTIALRLLLSLPVTVASGERSFSSLKRLKTYLRSTMSQDRLSALAVISIEHDITKTLDIDSVITKFAEAKARKVRF